MLGTFPSKFSRVSLPGLLNDQQRHEQRQQQEREIAAVNNESGGKRRHGEGRPVMRRQESVERICSAHEKISYFAVSEGAITVGRVGDSLLRRNARRCRSIPVALHQPSRVTTTLWLLRHKMRPPAPPINPRHRDGHIRRHPPVLLFSLPPSLPGPSPSTSSPLFLQHRHHGQGMLLLRPWSELARYFYITHGETNVRVCLSGVG